MASLNGSAARSTAAGGHATAVQRCFVPRLPHRGITAQAASSAFGPQRKAAQRLDSSVRSPVVVASSNKDSQAAREAGPAPAVRAAQQTPMWRLAAVPLLALLACWLLPLPKTQPWPADWAVLLALVVGSFVGVSSVKKMQAVNDQQYVDFLLRRKPPAAVMAEQARKSQRLKRSAEDKLLFILLVGVAVASTLLVAEVLSRALLGHGLAGYLLQPVLTLSDPPDPDWSVPLWFVVALPFLSFAGEAAGEAHQACSRRRLFWLAAAARRQANAARLAAKHSGAQQPSTQP